MEGSSHFGLSSREHSFHNFFFGCCCFCCFGWNLIIRSASQLTGETLEEELGPHMGLFCWGWDHQERSGFAQRVYGGGSCRGDIGSLVLRGWSEGPWKGERSVGKLSLGSAFDHEWKEGENALGWVIRALFTLGLCESRTLKTSV